MLNTPDYYNSHIEVIDFIEAYNLNFSLGNVIKYITRAGNKPSESKISDLNKALNYLEHSIRTEQQKLSAMEFMTQNG